MYTEDEERAIAAIAALLAKVAAPRRGAIASAALHRLSATPTTTRDAPTQRVSGRVPKPSRDR